MQNNVTRALKRVLRGFGFDDYIINQNIVKDVPLSRAVAVELTRKGLFVSYESGKTGDYKFVNDYVMKVLGGKIGRTSIKIA